MKKVMWLELGFLCLYFMDILALPFSQLDFWLLTFAFLGAGAEVGLGGLILGRLLRRFQLGQLLQKS